MSLKLGIVEVRYRKEILSNTEAVAELHHIKELSMRQDVRLICHEKTHPCRRFILLDMINSLIQER
jgi:hypothetical protein